MVWNESHYLAGDIGKNISVARRSGTSWFFGNWKHIVHPDFLTAGKVYRVTVFVDEGKGGIRKKIVEVKKGDAFSIEVKAKEGQAVMIELKQ